MSEYSEAEQMERAKSWLKTNGIWIIAGIAIVTWSQFGSSVHGALGKAKTTFEDNVPH